MELMKTYLMEKHRLTIREIDVSLYIIQGYTNNEIAKLLNISTHTVKAHISSLLKKFNTTRRISLAICIVKELLKNNIYKEAYNKI